MELANNINALAAQLSDYTAKNLSRLIKIKSLSLQEKGVSEAIVEMMKEAGFDDFIGKPYKKKAFVDIILKNINNGQQ